MKKLKIAFLWEKQKNPICMVVIVVVMGVITGDESMTLVMTTPTTTQIHSSLYIVIVVFNILISILIDFVFPVCSWSAKIPGTHSSGALSFGSIHTVEECKAYCLTHFPNSCYGIDMLYDNWCWIPVNKAVSSLSICSHYSLNCPWFT